MYYIKRVISLLLAAAFLFGTVAPTAAEAATPEMTIYALHLSLDWDPEAEGLSSEYGDVVIIESKGKYVLFDTGHCFVWGSVHDYIIEKMKVPQFEAIYISHLHGDHIYNLTYLIERDSNTYNRKTKTYGYNGTKAVYLPDKSIGKEYVSNENHNTQPEIYKSWQKHSFQYNPDVKIKYLKKGSSFSFGSVKVDVIGPVGKYHASDFKDDRYGRGMSHYLNNSSLTSMITCGDVKFLTCGDIEKEEEANLLKKYGSKLDADIFKASHHGLKNSNSKKFLDAVSPQFSFMCNGGYEDTVKSNGKTVRKVHTVTKRLQNYGIPYIVNNEERAVIYKVKNNKITMYRDENMNGKAEKSERFGNGWNTVTGIAMTKKGAYTGDDKYYFKNGAPVSGVQEIDGKSYYFSKGGALQKGLYKKQNGKWVYQHWREYGKRWRYFRTDGSMVVGWKTIDGARYYFKPKTGYRSEGLTKIGKSTYYFDKKGKLQKNKTVKVGNKKIKLDKKGRVIKA